jgi:replicative DNA helicase
MYSDNEAIDLITLQQRLKDKGLLEQVGGVAYLLQLQDAAPSAANLSYYLDVVKDKYVLRSMVTVCTDVVGRIYDFEGQVDQLMDEVERDVLQVAESRVSTAIPPISEIVLRVIDKIEMYFNRKGEITGLKTGFSDFDKLTDGLQPSTMVVIAARPSMGKTSLALNIVENVAVENNIPVGVFSMEMSSDDLIMRMACSQSRVSLSAIRGGFIRDDDLVKLTGAAGRIRKAPIYIDDTGGLSILQLRARARRMHQRYGIKLIVIDYLQLMSSTARRGRENRQQEVSDISAGIKALAKELRIPIIVLSQLNREIEKDKGRKPRLSDLRESGSIEQDSDLVGLLYKPDDSDNKDEELPEEGDGCRVNIRIAKQRCGPTGDVQLTFLKPYTRFESAAKVSEEDIPADRRSSDS